MDASFLTIDPTILLLVLAWTLPWKGVALWKAARQSDQKWFIAILVLNTLALLEILYLFVFSARSAPAGDDSSRRSP